MLSYVTDSAEVFGLARREFGEPEPRPDEAVVSVQAYAVSRGETHLLQLRPNAFRPGQEVAGVIVRGAEDGSGPAVGTRVAGLVEGKGWSQRVAVPTCQLGVVPDSVPISLGPTAPSALMALRALREAAPQGGRRVLVAGATGAVGYMAVQLALIEGAEVTALVNGPHRAGVLAGFPAATVATSLDEASGPFDLVLDGVGGPVLTDAIRRLAPGGLALSYGAVTGEAAALVPGDFRGAPGSRLGGFFLWLTEMATVGRDLSRLLELYADGRLSPLVGLSLDWLDTADMVRAIRAREVLGKGVLTLSG